MLSEISKSIFDRPSSPFDESVATVVTSSSCSSASSTESSRYCVKMLPEDFVPTPYTVICGRGRRCTDNVGNRRLHIIASMFIPRYSLCTKKEEKSIIVSDILDMVQQACPDKSMAFVRFADGRWWEADTLNAREKVGTVLRDALHSKYRSSTKSKLQRRKKRKDIARKARLQKNLDGVRNPMFRVNIVPLTVAC